jgi:mRNA interferase RelE/StbE
MLYKVVYHGKVVHDDLAKITAENKNRIKKAIETKIAVRPDIFSKPLHRPLGGYRNTRVGDYRIVFRVEGKKVLIFGIIHRSWVYKELEKRG